MTDRRNFLLLALCVCFARAHDSSSHTPAYGFSQLPVFDLEFSYDLEIDDNSESQVRWSSTTTTAFKTPFTNSNGCYDEASCCLVSSHALISSEDESFTVLEEFSFSDEEEEDDNDDDDGHSSMLSNASLSRRHRMVGLGAREGIREQVQREQAPSENNSRRQFSPALAFSQQNHSRRPAFTAALRVRGGDSLAGSELTKKLLVTALVTLIYEGMIGHVLEFIKIRMQVGDFTSYGQVIRDITAEKGIVGLWDGFIPWGVVQALFKGSVFGLAHAAALGYLLPLAEEGKLPLVLALTLAGGIGGGFQGYVLSPTLLLKTRVMTNPVFRERMSLLRTTWLSFCLGFDVVKTEGLLTLMKGANVFATKRVFDWATRFFFSDLLEALFLSMKNGSSLTFAEKSLASFLGGVASTCSTLPLDVLVAKTQDAKKAGVKVSAWSLFSDELQEKGWSGLTKAYMSGFEARLLHVCTTTVAIKTGTLIVYDFIFGKNE